MKSTKTLKHEINIKNIVMDDIERFLEEDLGSEGDITSDSLFTDENSKAHIITKEDCIIAGLDEIKDVFERTGAKTELMVKSGDFVKKGNKIAIIRGRAKSILKGERLAINIMGRMSGIATETKKLVDICKSINPNITIASTRKTTPGFRKYEKKAVVIGGGEYHRFGLYDAVMIKDNHIKLVGSVEKAIMDVKDKIKDKIIEVEVENEKDALTAARLDVDVIMLDNIGPKTGRDITKKIKDINKKIIIEISGGITSDNIKSYASFADRISLGYITHSIKSIDFSLEII
jgi:nicotinate-nucleotide pyrophosphorylase (carboxylating)